MLVYLAGPIAGTNDYEAKSWRVLARGVLTEHGIGVLDPMVRDFRGREYATEDTPALIVEGDKRDIDQSDLILASCWQPSVGTSMEILYAFERKKPVIIHVPHGSPVSPWLTYHSILVTPSIHNALDWILRANSPFGVPKALDVEDGGY